MHNSICKTLALYPKQSKTFHTSRFLVKNIHVVGSISFSLNTIFPWIHGWFAPHLPTFPFQPDHQEAEDMQRLQREKQREFQDEELLGKRHFRLLFPWIVRGFLYIGVPQNGWFIKENPMNMDDLGVPLFQETSIWETPMEYETPIIIMRKTIVILVFHGLWETSLPI